ncbi:hypothetical protein ACFTY7_14830 [Streptomyces sp. NPDC057062]
MDEQFALSLAFLIDGIATRLPGRERGADTAREDRGPSGAVR